MEKRIKTGISFLVFLVVWWLGSLVSKPLFLPNPFLVLKTIIQAIGSGVLIESLVASLLRVLMGTALAIIISLIIGTLTICSKTIKEFVLPITNAFRFLPTTVFYPLLILWVGIGEQMKVSFLFLATFLFFLPTVVHEFLNTPQKLIELGMMLGYNKRRIIKEVVFPNAMPNLAKSFLTMSAIGWTYCIVAETINTQRGLGYLINIGSARGKTELVFASLVTIIFINFVIDWFGNQIIKRKYHYRKEMQI